MIINAKYYNEAFDQLEAEGKIDEYGNVVGGPEVWRERAEALQLKAGQQPVQPKPEVKPKRSRAMCEADGRCFNSASEAVNVLAREGKIPMPKWKTWNGYAWLKKHKIPFKRI